MTGKEYDKMVRRASPASPVIKDCAAAFAVGGGICVIGQGLTDAYSAYFSFEPTAASTLTSMTLILLSVILTATGLYCRIARFAGAGTLVPITGFANAMSSQAIEYKTEGHVLGIGANMFKIAGPVIVFGVLSSVLYGLFLWLCTVFG